MKPRLAWSFCLLFLLAACTSETASPTPGAVATATPTRVSPTRTPTADPAPTLEPVEPIDLTGADITGLAIELWHPWDGAREGLLETLIAEFNRSNEFGLQVSAVRRHDLHADVSQALASGAPPDLVVGAAYHVRSWSRIEALPDWGRYLADDAWGLPEDDWGDFYPEFIASAQVDGRQTGLPFYRTAEVLLYNTSWAGELGFSGPPTTPAGLQEQACAANAALRSDADPSNDGEGGLMLGYEPWAITAWMTGFGGSPEPQAGGEDYAFDREQNITAFIFLRTLLDDLCAWIPEGVYPHDEFAARRGLFLPSTLAGLAPQAEAMSAAGNPDTWVAIPYPTAEGGRAPLFSGPDLVLMPAGPERQLAAWVFARWLLAPERLAAWADQTGYLPPRAAALASMAAPPAEAGAWIREGGAYGPPASWVAVQWAVSEMARMLFSPFTPLDDIPGLAVELDRFAEEIP